MLFNDKKQDPGHFRQGRPSIDCSNDDEVRSPASEVSILVHHRGITFIKRKRCLHDIVMTIDFKVDKKIFVVRWTQLEIFYELFQ